MLKQSEKMAFAKEAYVALGGNVGDTQALFQEALSELESNAKISELEVSSFYRTRPDSPIPQPDFLNAVCRFKTTYSPHALLHILQEIEAKLGKIPKPKDAPRPIDLDLLFYDMLTLHTHELTLPHPGWKERVFVLLPLAELTDAIEVLGENGIEKYRITKEGALKLQFEAV